MYEIYEDGCERRMNSYGCGFGYGVSLWFVYLLLG